MCSVLGTYRPLFLFRNSPFVSLKFGHTFNQPPRIRQELVSNDFRLSVNVKQSHSRATGTTLTAAHGTVNSLNRDVWCFWSRVSCNSAPPDPSAAGTVPSSTWGRRSRRTWMTRASWCLALDGEADSSPRLSLFSTLHLPFDACKDARHTPFLWFLLLTNRYFSIK